MLDNGGKGRAIDLFEGDLSNSSMYGLVRIESSSGLNKLLGSKCPETDGDIIAAPPSRSVVKFVSNG